MANHGIAIEFVFTNRTVLVPAGADCRVRDGAPGTPLFIDAAPDLRDLVEKFDASGVSSRTGSRERLVLASLVTGRCTVGRDTLILWHLLADRHFEIRAMAAARLQELEGPLPGARPTKGSDEQPFADPALWLPYLRLGAWSRPQ